ncbi:hypothetical protein ACGFX7_23760 [Streptomyces harbinensis]|uniref:hypothetical protein n=1 Tax=Streptomyces harbinensis TaxID=1176198 RepID=UPI003721DCBD
MHRLAHFSALLVTLGLVTACSLSQNANLREYVVPESLCGTDMDPEILKALLPAGKEIEITGRGADEDDNMGVVGSCFVFVDDFTAIGVQTMGATDHIDGHGPLPPGIDSYLNALMTDLDINDSTLLAENPIEVRVWKNFAAAYVPCVSSRGEQFTGMNVSVDLRDNKERDYSEELGRMMESFAIERVSQMGETCVPA